MPGGRSPHHSLGRRALGPPARCGVTGAPAEINTISFGDPLRQIRAICFSRVLFQLSWGYLLG
jgi:hypothetical protein